MELNDGKNYKDINYYSISTVKMMNERIVQAIYKAVDEVNEQLPKEYRIEKSMETALFGRTGSLDSLGLVSMIVAVEQKIEEEFGVAIVLADEKVLSQQTSPFQTIGTLVNHVSMLLKEKLNG